MSDVIKNEGAKKISELEMEVSDLKEHKRQKEKL